MPKIKEPEIRRIRAARTDKELCIDYASEISFGLSKLIREYKSTSSYGTFDTPCGKLELMAEMNDYITFPNGGLHLNIKYSGPKLYDSDLGHVDVVLTFMGNPEFYPRNPNEKLTLFQKIHNFFEENNFKHFEPENSDFFSLLSEAYELTKHFPPNIIIMTPYDFSHKKKTDEEIEEICKMFEPSKGNLSVARGMLGQKCSIPTIKKYWTKRNLIQA